jgi:hypothetical protein
MQQEVERLLWVIKLYDMTLIRLSLMVKNLTLKEFPETYMRNVPDTFKHGGMARGGGAAIKGTKFKGVF